jgi:hypothetical protein
MIDLLIYDGIIFKEIALSLAAGVFIYLFIKTKLNMFILGAINKYLAFLIMPVAFLYGYLPIHASPTTYVLSQFNVLPILIIYLGAFVAAYAFGLWMLSKLVFTGYKKLAIMYGIIYIIETLLFIFTWHTGVDSYPFLAALSLPMILYWYKNEGECKFNPFACKRYCSKTICLGGQRP